ncbi:MULTISPECIES: MBL fold metallo-hydrolase [Thermus]|uniref:MBL fold metallo-hydrolase n=1 Tax=Thermus brockianus TaxID=56956 RepID=A0A1J0LS01_THEBO|nr:MBL fold metallo-hydrolase [Thermus brockianus]APD09024.1 metallo-beta-lactamase [Thermus brockianus]BDG15543.1 MBL fold metallo-hydrolase [Thermus brockianus]
MSAIPVLNVGYRSTHYWLIGQGPARLLVDLGWPGTFGALKMTLRRVGVDLKEVRFGLATHYHIDHAGLAQELKEAGMTLLVMENQVEAIPHMRRFAKPQDRYRPIQGVGNRLLSFTESRAFLASLGIPGEILPTPGHTDHCVSLLLDDGRAFTGDLPPEEGAWDNPVAQQSWASLRAKGARLVYPGHGPVRPLD